MSCGMDRRKQGASEDGIFQFLCFPDHSALATIRKSPPADSRSV